MRLLLALLGTQLSRRSALQFLGGGAAAVAVPRAVAAADSLPPAAVILRVAEVTSYQEDLLRRAASYSDDDRERAGYSFGRNQFVQSVDILLKNTNLAALPGCTVPALTLNEVRVIATQGSGALTTAEYLSMASRYSRARDELRVAFEAMPEKEQATGKSIVRRLTYEDNLRKAEAKAEEEAEARKQLARRLYTP